MSFQVWYERYGASLSEREARLVWKAAIDAAYDLLNERSKAWRKKVSASGTDIDGDFAAAKQLEARACASDIFELAGARA